MYQNVDETNSLLDIMALEYPNLCQVFNLDWQTFEGRDVKAIRVSTGTVRAKHGVLIIGGLHAREWGNTDIVMLCLENLLTSYATGTDIQYGARSYPAADVRAAMDSVELFVIPVANPDGKVYSFLPGESLWGFPKSMWRKNRRDNNWGLCFGVDLNRNFDWLWHYRQTTHPLSWAENTNNCQGAVWVSDFPCDETYQGPAPFSEPETKNVRDLLDANPHIRFFVDVHGTQGVILRPWADDEIQTSDPDMSFKNSQYDGLRGLADDNLTTSQFCPPPNPDGAAYKDYMNPVDDSRLTALADEQTVAVNAVRGQSYTHGPSFTTLYGITGGTKDYIYARHLCDPQAGKVDTFLYEYGVGTPFQPPYEDPNEPDDMVRIMADCASGLTTLVLRADSVPIVSVAPGRLDFGKQRLGATKQGVVSLTNLGPHTIMITGVGILSDPDNTFSAAMPSPPDAATGQTRSVTVTSNPATSGSHEALLQINFRHESGGLTDTRLVGCAVDVCTTPGNACVAPVFDKPGIFACLLLYLTIPAAIAALSLFIWIPGILCLILRLIFILNNCGKGNDDPCIVLMSNKWSYRR